jgi:putative hydrolase of the HAD superfamily
MTVEIVFFDAGDTLLRPEPSFPELAARVVSGRGHAVTSVDITDAGRAVAHHFRLAAEQRRFFSASADESRAFWTTLYTEMLEHMGIDDPGAPDALVDVFSDPDSYGVFADTVPCLSDLKARGFRLGVISNFEGWLTDVLRNLGLHDFFDVLAISGPLGVEKPDPKIFEWAVAEAGVEPWVCVHVGDQPYFDADAAAACGLRPVLLDRYGRWADIDGTYPVIPTLDELSNVVDGL